MEEVSTPVIAIALILASVFIPTAFIPGISGRLFQQFALTIAMSVVISAFNALTLSPALAAQLLRPREERRGPIGRLFGGFNRAFAAATNGYIRISGLLIRRSAFALLFLALVGGERVPGRAPGALDVSAAGGSGLRVRRDAVAECGVACSAPTPRRAEIEEIMKHTAGVQGYIERRRIQPAQPGAGNLQQLLLRHAQAVGRAPDGGRDSSQH